MKTLHPLSVAIVIAGRNYGRYLHQTIDSAFTQTYPCEIVYCDDGSDDDSLQVANSFLKFNVTPGYSYRVIPSLKNEGVVTVRNRGAAATHSDFIIFLDADDWLPKDYVQQMVATAIRNPNAPFYYSNTQAFGDSNTLWRITPWSLYDKWYQNQVSTSAMWSRSAFMAAGMWHDLPTMWDYDLALRCSKLGTPVPSPSVLNYRIHSASMSAVMGEREVDKAIPHKERIRRKNATMGIGCLYSGRLPGLFHTWIGNLATSVRQCTLRVKPRLLLLLDKPAQTLLPVIEKDALFFADDFSSIEFKFYHPARTTDPSPQKVNIPHLPKNVDASLLAELNRRHNVCTMLAHACSTIQHELSTDIVWLVEDDIVVPAGACSILHDHLTSGHVPPMGVSGAYRNRHISSQYVGGWIQNEKHIEPSDDFAPVVPVDFVGTGCLMYWRDRLYSPKIWRPYSTLESAAAHDWAWSEDVKSKGGELLMCGSVPCRHYNTEVSYV